MKTMSRLCNQLFVPLPAIPGMTSSQVLSTLPRWLYIILYRPKCDLLYCGLLFKVKNTNNPSRGKGVQGGPTHPSSHCPGPAGRTPPSRGGWVGGFWLSVRIIHLKPEKSLEQLPYVRRDGSHIF